MCSYKYPQSKHYSSPSTFMGYGGVFLRCVSPAHQMYFSHNLLELGSSCRRGSTEKHWGWMLVTHTMPCKIASRDTCWGKMPLHQARSSIWDLIRVFPLLIKHQAAFSSFLWDYSCFSLFSPISFCYSCWILY